MINRNIRIIATIAGYAGGAAQVIEGATGHDLVRAVTGLGMIFFVAVLGERPRPGVRKQ